MKTATTLIRRTARTLTAGLTAGLIGLLPAFAASTQAQAQSKSMADLNVRLGVPYTRAATENGPMTLALDFYAPKGGLHRPAPDYGDDPRRRLQDRRPQLAPLEGIRHELR